MPQYLYRYISFETFVGMVQKQALTFVLPKVWDDPKERTAFYSFIEKRENTACFAEIIQNSSNKLLLFT